jgi:hypothetical protein
MRNKKGVLQFFCTRASLLWLLHSLVFVSIGSKHSRRAAAVISIIFILSRSRVADRNLDFCLIGGSTWKQQRL